MPEREFSPAYRAELAERGEAMPDGSYPTPDADALERAIEAYGREKPAKLGQLRHYLVRRAVALGRVDLLPDDWKIRSTGDHHRPSRPAQQPGTERAEHDDDHDYR